MDTARPHPPPDILTAGLRGRRGNVTVLVPGSVGSLDNAGSWYQEVWGSLDNAASWYHKVWGKLGQSLVLVP